MEIIDILDHLGHQTDNANMAKIVRKNKKYGRCQIFCKIINKNGH